MVDARADGEHVSPTDYIFADAAARDAAMPTPIVSSTCVLRDTGELLVYYGTGLGWRPPWNTAWGLRAEGVVDIATFHFSSTASPAPIVSSAAHVELLAGRRYEVRIEIHMSAVVPGELVTLYALYSSDDETIQNGGFVWNDIERSVPYTFAASQTFTAEQLGRPTGSHLGTWYLGFVHYATIAQLEYPSGLRIYDLGPAGPPA